MEDYYYNEDKEDIFLKKIYELEEKNIITTEENELYVQEMISLLKIHHYYMVSMWKYLDNNQYNKAINAFVAGKNIYNLQIKNIDSSKYFNYNYNHMVISIIQDALKEKEIIQFFTEKELLPFKTEVKKVNKLNQEMLKLYGTLYYIK